MLNDGVPAKIQLPATSLLLFTCLSGLTADCTDTDSEASDNVLWLLFVVSCTSVSPSTSPPTEQCMSSA